MAAATLTAGLIASNCGTAFGDSGGAVTEENDGLIRSSEFAIYDLQEVHDQLMREFSRRPITQIQLEELKKRLLEQLNIQRSLFEQAEKLNKTADEFFLKRRFPEAIKAYTQILELKNLAVKEPFLLKRGQCYEEMGELDKAVDDYQSGLAAGDTYRAMFRLRLGKVLMRQGLDDEALEQFSRSIDEEEGNFLSPFGARADLYMKSRDFEKALSDYTKAIDNYIDYFKEKGVSLVGDKIDHSQTATLGFLYQDRSRAQTALLKYEQAVADLELAETYTLPALRESVSIALARAYEDAGQKERAGEKRESVLKKHNEKIETDPTARAFHDRGLVFLELDLPDRAASDFARAVSLKPEDPDNYYHLGQARIDMDETNGAVEALSKAISLSPSESKYYYERGCCYLKSKKLDRALEDAEKSIELDKTRARYYELRGTILDKLGRKKEARADHEKASSMGSAAEDLP
ncbi:MAG: tetratricopeptide repeat protein [Cyanobacteria bacterium HKST-UBA02]|nr:tetratricopeptide repeat protein [Cyanobacteria bacterium HKST-UBA02]